jgi:hypothetical protein
VVDVPGFSASWWLASSLAPASMTIGTVATGAGQKRSAFRWVLYLDPLPPFLLLPPHYVPAWRKHVFNNRQVEALRIDETRGHHIGKDVGGESRLI